MEYIRSLGDQKAEEGCFLCRYWDGPQHDRANHVVWRGETVFVVMNRFPYTNGHLLIAYAGHKGDMSELSDNEMNEMSSAIRSAVDILKKTLSPQGFNIGYNLGICAGAGLPDHLHAHIVPRWTGDTNFMAVVGDSRVIPDALDTLYGELGAAAEASGLR
jgi:ATP adenylyltransferase